LLLRDAGISVNACPRSDAQWALGTEAMGLQQALNYGIRPGLSVDNGTAYSIDLFGEMHAALVLQRWAAHGASKRGEAVPPRLTVRDMLEFATVRGAQNAALAHKIGTLTPGKEADIVLIRAGDINTLPLTNAVATVVSHAHAGNVDTVVHRRHTAQMGRKIGRCRPRRRARAGATIARPIVCAPGHEGGGRRVAYFHRRSGLVQGQSSAKCRAPAPGSQRHH
jgi:cytosine/adenosine deaminase-related metal-dependent hydrolase